MSLPRSTVTTLSAAIHGARDFAELQRLGLRPDDVIDFSTNSNPYGPHPAVLQAMREALADPALARRYPDRDCLALRAAIAATDAAPAEYVLPGNGATELIHLIALTFVKPGSRHLILSPTFGEYARGIQLLGGKICECWPKADHNLHLDVEEVGVIIRQIRPDGIWLCNPNNPTGQYWTPDELAHLRAADTDHQALWVVDEAYRCFVDPAHTSSVDDKQWVWGKNLIRLRSLTKDYSLAGLRLGYCLADPEIIDILKVVQPPWSVNSLAQVGGVAALQHEVISWCQTTLAQLHQHAFKLWAGLTDLGFMVHPTTTTFALTRVNNAPEFHGRLLPRGFLVRDCTSFGLPNHVRIAAHRPAANDRLLAAIRELPE